MNVELGIWDKLTKVVLFLLVVAIAGIVAVWYLPLIQQNERMRKDVLKLNDQIKAEEEKASQLKGAIDSRRNDPKAIAREAREKLGYAKPGETVIRFQEPSTNSASKPRSE